MGNSNVIAACEKHLPSQAGNCSGFVHAVARDFGIILTGQANDMFNAMTKGKIPGIINYGPGIHGAFRAAKDASNGEFLVVGASYSDSGHGHVAIVVGADDAGHVLVYGGMLNHPDKASKNSPITKRAWAIYKLTNMYVAAEPPFFFGIRIRPPFIG